MKTVTLGRTGLTVNQTGFGALPIQRADMKTAEHILRKAYDGGINFFDTARWYSDSEEKLGRALGHARDRIVIATKSGAADADGLWKDLHTSLSMLRTDYIDIYQFHNPAAIPKPRDGTGLYETMREAREQGKIRFIGITNHRLHLAREAVKSGLYDVLQFPFSYLSNDGELSLVNLCEDREVGFIAMKALSGGLITNARAAFAYMAQYNGILPIWGIQREEELDEFLAMQDNPPAMDGGLLAAIEADRAALTGNFCRGCGYCMPCPEGIQIHLCARMSLLIRRSPSAQHLTEQSQAMMSRIDGCTRCRQCALRCPYELDTPELLARNYADYKEILKRSVGTAKAGV